jgi:GAF domain-containing protein
MQAPAYPIDEDARIASLRRMLILDTEDDAAFDRVTRLAQALFDVPIALVSLVDTNRQWFKSCIGLPVRETGRDISFCGHAILDNQLFVIENALNDPRFADNPLVTDAPHIRFYAGYPLKNPEGHNIGTLCIIDRVVRSLTSQQRDLMRDLAKLTEEAMYVRQLSDAQLVLLEELDFTKREAQLDKSLRIWHREAIFRLLENEVVLCLAQRGPTLRHGAARGTGRAA